MWHRASTLTVRTPHARASRNRLYAVELYSPFAISTKASTWPTYTSNGLPGFITTPRRERPSTTISSGSSRVTWRAYLLPFDAELVGSLLRRRVGYDLGELQQLYEGIAARRGGDDAAVARALAGEVAALLAEGDDGAGDAVEPVPKRKRGS